ncbi:MAG: glycosyltransferase family 39 protein [Chloroflexi bacterium]|nr:glycosyltransferase family 39 protein [Chloroflexota bacterium]
MTTRRLQLMEYGLLALIVGLYLALAYGYATRTPTWQIPDEPAHYNYVRQIAENGELPVLQMGDWDSVYLDQLKGSGFDPAVTQNIGRVQYEDHQPPLYYLVESVVYRLSDGDIETLRIFSALMGAGAVICAWAIVRRLLPSHAWIGLSAAALVAFIPQRLAIMGGVSNDSLAETLAGLVLLMVTIYLTPTQSAEGGDSRTAPIKMPVIMGLLVGLAFLTKTTVYYVGVVAGLAVLWRCWHEKWPLKKSISQILAFGLPAVILGGIWWVHGVQTYGGTDILGLQRHDKVVVGQLRTEDYIENELDGSQQDYWENLGETTFHSFWGQLGWMALPMPPRIYQGLLLVSLVMVGGVGVYSWQVRWPKSIHPVWGLFILGTLLVFAQFLVYNRTFVQFQGRYLYPALIPLALGNAVGLCGWAELGVRLIKWRWLPYLVFLIPLGLVGLAWYVLNDIVVLLP